MTKDEAMDLALEALEETLKTLDDANAIPGGPIADTIWYSPYETLFDYLEVRIAAIKQARSAPVQEPVAYFVNCTNCGEEKKVEQGNHHPWCFCGSDSFDWGNSRDAAPVKPVAWRVRYYYGTDGMSKRTGNWKLVGYSPTPEKDKDIEPLYTTPPVAQPAYTKEDLDRAFSAGLVEGEKLAFESPAAQRQWVGLTEQEAAECWSTGTVRTWQAIEAKLKEKNT